MENFQKGLIKRLKEEKTNYSEMVEFCADSLVLNNYILPELEKNGYYFEPYCGNPCYYLDENGEEITRKEYEKQLDEGKDAREEYADIYQYYIIDSVAAQRFADYTNEIVLYNEDLDLYLLCVTHLGTPWRGVAANWKNPDDEEDEEDEDEEDGEQDEEQDDDEGGRE